MLQKNSLIQIFMNLFFLYNYMKIFFLKYETINYKILGCYKLLSNKDNFLHNYGFYIVIIIFGGFLVLIK